METLESLFECLGRRAPDDVKLGEVFEAREFVREWIVFFAREGEGVTVGSTVVFVSEKSSSSSSSSSLLMLGVFPEDFELLLLSKSNGVLRSYG